MRFIIETDLAFKIHSSAYSTLRLDFLISVWRAALTLGLRGEQQWGLGALPPRVSTPETTEQWEGQELLLSFPWLDFPFLHPHASTHIPSFPKFKSFFSRKPYLIAKQHYGLVSSKFDVPEYSHENVFVSYSFIFISTGLRKWDSATIP